MDRDEADRPRAIAFIGDSPIAWLRVQAALAGVADIELLLAASVGELDRLMVLRRPGVVVVGLREHRDARQLVAALVGEWGLACVVLAPADWDAAHQAELRVAGAARVVPTPDPADDPREWSRQLLLTLRGAVRLRVVRPLGAARPRVWERDPWPLAVIGASTGGPAGVRRIVGRMHAGWELTTIVVQHLPPGGEHAFIDHLRREARVPIVAARDGLGLAPGEVVVVPGDAMLALTPALEIRLGSAADDAAGGQIDAAMRAVASIAGERAIGVVLSGMGQDGVAGLRAIRDSGGTTLVQDAAGCLAESMPRAAIRAGVADVEADIDTLAGLLERQAGGNVEYIHVRATRRQEEPWWR